MTPKQRFMLMHRGARSASRGATHSICIHSLVTDCIRGKERRDEMRFVHGMVVAARKYYNEIDKARVHRKNAANCFREARLASIRAFEGLSEGKQRLKHAHVQLSRARCSLEEASRTRRGFQRPLLRFSLP